MKWFNGNRIRLVLVGLIAAIVVASGRSARAEFTFGTPTNLGPTINRGPTINSFYEDSAPSISSDGLTLYFSSDRSGGSGSFDLWVARRESTENEWGTTVNLGPIVNASSYDDWPSISSDGLSLYFSSFRPGGFGSDDIWVTTRATAEGDWSSPVNLGQTVNSSSGDFCPNISADGLSLFFVSERPGGSGGWDIWMANRKSISNNWSAPVNLGSTVNSWTDEARPSISADGLSLFFSSNRPGGYGNHDLWVTARATKDGSWGTPVNLGPMVNSSAWDSDTAISADGLSLIFASYRRGGTGGLDIFVVTRPTISEPFGTPIDISANYESGPCISPDGLELFFDSDRPGGYGYEDLWVARRQTVDDDWETPVNLGEVVNSSFGELAPRISADGLLLLFASDRPGGSGNYDIWMASRTTTQDSWTTPVNLGSVVNSPDYDHCATISPDGLELFFASAREADYGQTDVWVSTRATRDSEWDVPVPLPEPINSSGFDGAPSISADGLSLFFYSSRTGSQAADIWVTTRPSIREPWDPPVNLGPILNSRYGDLSPSISPDGSTLFFCSHRPGGFGGFDIWQATIMPLPDLEMSFGNPNHLGWDINMNWTKDAFPSVSADGLTLYFESHRLFEGYGAGDLYVTTRATTDDDWGRPTPLPEPVNSSHDEATPCVSADGLSLFFSSNQPGGYGNHDLWLTTRATKDGSWGTPVNLGPIVNSSIGETKPSISADGLSLFFDSARSGGSGSWDIWVTSRPTTDNNWGAPVPLPPPVNSSSADGEPSISVDGLMLFFTSNRPGGYGDLDLWVTTRKSTEDDWGTPVNLGPNVNQTYEDMGPCISADGSTLYYTVGGPVGFLDLYEFDLWEVPVLPVNDFNNDEMAHFDDPATLKEYRLWEASWH